MEEQTAQNGNLRGDEHFRRSGTLTGGEHGFHGVKERRAVGQPAAVRSRIDQPGVGSRRRVHLDRRVRGRAMRAAVDIVAGRAGDAAPGDEDRAGAGERLHSLSDGRDIRGPNGLSSGQGKEGRGRQHRSENVPASLHFPSFSIGNC